MDRRWTADVLSRRGAWLTALGAAASLLCVWRVNGSRLRDLRVARGLTQEEFAERLGIALSTLRRWEGTDALARYENIVAAAQLLNVSAEFLASPSPRVPTSRAPRAPARDADGPSGDTARSGQLTASSGELTASSGEPTASSGQPTASSGQPTASSGQLSARSGEPTASSGQLAASSGQLAASSGQRNASSGELSASSGELADEQGPTALLSGNDVAPPFRIADARGREHGARPRPLDNPLMRPSTLSKLADEDWDANVPDPTPDDGVDRLSAAWLKSVYTAFLVHEGKRFVVRGAVIDERGLLPDECDRLGAQMGIAARFRVAIVRTGSPMSITVVTTSALLTSRCQEASRGRMIAEWTVELRTFDEPSFWTWESPTRRPWVLLVVAIR